MILSLLEKSRKENDNISHHNHVGGIWSSVLRQGNRINKKRRQ